MRWLNTSSGFTAIIGEEPVGTIRAQEGGWLARSGGGAERDFTILEDAKVWLEAELSGD